VEASSFSDVVQSISRRSHSTLARSVPALSVYHVPQGSSSSLGSSGVRKYRETIEVATKKRKRRTLNLPSVDKSQFESGGFYYGITSQTLSKASTASDSKKRPRLSDSMYEALEELRMMRMEMEAMRKEMQTLKRKMVADGDIEEDSEEIKAQARLAKRRRARDCEKLAGEIEEWATRIIKEGEEDGWKEVSCNKMMRGTLNPTERTKAYLKWMKDSRGDKANKDDDNEYPCIKCVARIDAPLEDVCTYLSQESASPEYNDVVHKHRDIEEISPNAKLCWSQSPQILFLKPRDFVTFCHHRWKGDGTEVMVNQAMDHPDYPANDQEKDGKACRAYALRGANILSRCPDDPDNKTIVQIVAHANPGGVPQWAAKTAVNALAPIEPFKLFHKINEHVQRNQPQLRERLHHAEMVGSNLPKGRSPRPAGMAQLGYACFWPNGGGVYEGSHKQSNDSPSNHDATTNSEGESDRVLGEEQQHAVEAESPEVRSSKEVPVESF